ncbi:hypothetical protein BT63DRAFT_455658 [Microthyrium microscopicum]|uniref:C2H2-type domain-containing protein n=1 Tax=Microthyrium microscopicum TaxID=703497 RepID=A0A6A6UDM6_9PEZI|nr:hypothetical protein BT63DRAFT_455658 [Microthyrium microscopicum]
MHSVVLLGALAALASAANINRRQTPAATSCPAIAPDFLPGTDPCCQVADTISTSIMSCDSVAESWGIKVSDFITLNPSVKADCSNLKDDQRYCVYSTKPTNAPIKALPAAGKPAPGPTMGTKGKCDHWQKVFPDDTCAGIVEFFGKLNQFHGKKMTRELLVKLNPYLNKTAVDFVTLECLECDLPFKSRASLEDHLQTSPAHLSFDCEECNLLFSNEDELHEHYRCSVAHLSDSDDSDNTNVTGSTDLAEDTDATGESNITEEPDAPEQNSLPQDAIRKENKLTKGGWTMFPSHHEQITSELQGTNLVLHFNDNDDDDFILKVDRDIHGRFTCENPACKYKHRRTWVRAGWESMTVEMTIRLYSGNRYNAGVYLQRCHGCHKLGKMNLDDSFAEHVAYRLKQWHGIKASSPTFSVTTTGPHMRSKCQACLMGRPHGHSRR